MFQQACDSYAALGVDVERAIEAASDVPISLHCWQGDDVAGFEGSEALGGGLAVTGNYRGRARNADELRSDLDEVLRHLPGRHRLNLHASYAETQGGRVARTDLQFEHFKGWVDWCSRKRLGFDFNPTFFSHPLAADGFTLSHRDASVRAFWIAHGIACRRIAAEAAARLNTPAITNFWIPDGFKDTPVDRVAPRVRLEEALDQIFADAIDPQRNLDAVESKLFGIGSESCVVGSHEFYLGYAITRKKLYCLDAGHFHPTESVADKVSSVLQFVPGLLLHVSRGVRWDSDHVVTFDDPTRALLREVVAGDFVGRTFLGLDFFDASINRLAAWVIGARNTRKALLAACLEPRQMLLEAETSGDYTSRLAIQQEMSSLPFAIVWQELCNRFDVSAGLGWLSEIRTYEASELSRRD